MKAITIWQPWAWAIVYAGKDIENRTWRPPESVVGQRIAIHAGKKYDPHARFYLMHDPESPIQGLWVDQPELFVPVKDNIALGVIVATAALQSAVATSDSPWFGGPVGWVLSDVVPLKTPVPYKGMQGLWNVPDGLLSDG